MNKPGRSHFAGAFAALLFFARPAQAQSDPARLARGTFREYLELLSLPNDSAAPADIQKNVEWLERAFQKRGFTTKQLANAGKPMLYAEWPKKASANSTWILRSEPNAHQISLPIHIDGNGSESIFF